MNSIGFIGAGNMAHALVGAILSSQKITINLFDPSTVQCDAFLKDYKNTLICKDNIEVIQKSDLIFLAVKPQIIPLVLKEIGDPKKVVVSIAAGITLDYLEKQMPKSAIVRVMPNTPSLVRKMAAGVVFGKNIEKNQREQVLKLLQSAGTVITVNESQMDAVTGVSGSGPAFVARIVESFINAGVKEGLSYDESKKLVYSTFIGTVKLLEEKELTPDELVNMVSSPNGTTVAGRAVLESSNYQTIIENCVSAAANRSRELGK